MNKFQKNIAVIGAILAALTIAIGAFGAHGLERLVSEDALKTFETGVRYQMYHVLAIVALGLSTKVPVKVAKWVFRLFIFGIIVFSGSLYVLSLKEMLPFSVSFLGPITPLGGLSFIAGWLCFARGLLTIGRDN